MDNQNILHIFVSYFEKDTIFVIKKYYAFTIGKLDNETIGISARSLGDIDVSNIMKELGGGGHSSNAATQIKNKTLKEVKQDLIDLLEKQ